MLLLVVILASGPTDTSQQVPGDGPSMQWLASLVGVWDTTDTYYPVTGSPIVENAVRTCEFVMRETYLQCETVVTRPAGGGRTYRFLINHNPDFSRFEMVSIWSNVRHKLVQALVPDDERRRWRISNLEVIGLREQSAEQHSELVVESSGRILWTGWRVKDGEDPAAAKPSFVESWTRRTVQQ